ncbi:hypothetical protein B0T18DRAFT_394397 [Schizothecium vesticola]|uniref:NmrA-like domain-containing protein n=1 Tax=Schizothecium vesticola TaxID=314040 RepID=A0AA40EHD6_9PEZI|nr:hypothetical protein B0T18DRAFT_394397 [Schizothecium vesticola]
MATQTILVLGATGKQGGATIKSLLDRPKDASPIHILALTRNPSSPAAQTLATAHPDVVELVQGDSTTPEPIFSARPKGSIHAVYVVTLPGKVSEETQAIPLIEAAVAHGVQHIVLSSVDRGGDEKSWTNPTKIKHFYEKHNIELHLRELARAQPGKFTWTILRPVAFLDNWAPGMMGKMFSAMIAASMKPTTKLQLVSARDIGMFAAAALTDPERWAGRAVGLAGDELTLGEAQEKFERVTGQTLPQTWTFLGSLLLWMVADVGNMFAFFEEEGYGADIEARRRELPTQDFETWLREGSQFEYSDIFLGSSPSRNRNAAHPPARRKARAKYPNTDTAFQQSQNKLVLNSPDGLAV